VIGEKATKKRFGPVHARVSGLKRLTVSVPIPHCDLNEKKRKKMAVSVHQKRADAEKRGDSGTYGSVFGRKTERIGVLSETVDVGLSGQRRLDPQILRLKHEWVPCRVEQGLVAART
jgi:hypothetical protein